MALAENPETFKQRGLRGLMHDFINRIFIFKDLELLLTLLITKQRRRSVNKLASVANQMLLSKYSEEGP